MPHDGFAEDDEQQNWRPSAKRAGAGGEGSAPTADSTGGRSTGSITGFGGGKFGGGGGGTGGGKRGAVAKANYTKAKGATSAKSIKASARYYTTRENERGETMGREAFSKDRDELSRAETYERLERADQEHAYHYRVAVSPGTDREAEGVDLKEYTREVMREVERQQGGRASWVAVEHGREAAHTQRAHVHVIVSTDQKLNREDLEKFREHATRSWDDARENVRALERDPTIERDIQQMSRAQAQRDLSRAHTTRDHAGHERDQRSPEREPASRQREVPTRASRPQQTERLPDRPPERTHERDHERDGGRGR
jgi:hypothetical protein